MNWSEVQGVQASSAKKTGTAVATWAWLLPRLKHYTQMNGSFLLRTQIFLHSHSVMCNASALPLNAAWISTKASGKHWTEAWERGKRDNFKRNILKHFPMQMTNCFLEWSCTEVSCIWGTSHSLCDMQAAVSLPGDCSGRGAVLLLTSGWKLMCMCLTKKIF